MATLLLLLWPCLLPAAAAQHSPDAVWTAVDESVIARSGADRQIVPAHYRSFSLQRSALDDLLAQAPLEDSVGVERSGVILSLPLADGSYGRFRIVESPIMEPALAATFPDIRTWLGQGIDDQTATARFDLTPTGFHGQIVGWEGTTYIDPYQPGDTGHYISYRKNDLARRGPLVCHVSGRELPPETADFSKRGVAVKVASGSSRRSYRLAVAATGEYTAFHGGTAALGQAAIVTTMNRVNGIYEREVAVRMLLVANNNLLVYTNGNTDPYSNNDGEAMLGQNQSNLDAVIGSANYDIGHVFSTGGGGIAGLGVVCSNGQKAEGVTGQSAPVGDGFDVDYVAHEMGHQFEGDHSFNSTSDFCDGNRNDATAYEAGSGITIQAYAGICSPDNVLNNSVDYFHRISLNEILAYVGSGGGSSCGTSNATGNTPPVVSTTASFNVPISTPFELTATGSDANGDALTYLWEQFDLGPANPAGSLTDNGGPLFRNYTPLTSGSRTFPALASILSNTTTTWEQLPTVTRSRNFRVTVRDNRAGGGGTNEAATVLNFSSGAGPFLVTAPNTAVSWAAGSTQTVTWTVANTSAAPVSAANVRIRLSTDGGNTWPTVLAASVANNGSAQVQLPAGTAATSQARIRVEGVGNVFFDVSNSNFTITAGVAPDQVFRNGFETP